MGDFPDPLYFLPFIVGISLVPVLMIMTTSYAKLLVVFALLRNALGLQQVPPPMVTNGLALALTWFIMYPIGVQVMEVYEQSASGRGATAFSQALLKAKEPLREFLDKHTSDRERQFFIRAAERTMKPEVAKTIGPKDFVVLVPAFTISELTAAFLMGFLVFLPFIVIDLITASVLLAMGMQMMSPTVVSLPIKLLLFVILDGWSLLAHTLILSYT